MKEVLRAELKAQSAGLDSRIDKLETRMDSRSDKLEAKIDRIGDTLAQMLSDHEQRLRAIEQRPH